MSEFFSSHIELDFELKFFEFVLEKYSVFVRFLYALVRFCSLNLAVIFYFHS